MLEQNDEWSLIRRYMQLEGLQTLSDTVPTRQHAVARRVPRLSGCPGFGPTPREGTRPAGAIAQSAITGMKSGTTGKAGGLFCEPLEGAQSQRLKAQYAWRFHRPPESPPAIAHPTTTCILNRNTFGFNTETSRPRHTVKPA